MGKEVGRWVCSTNQCFNTLLQVDFLVGDFVRQALMIFGFHVYGSWCYGFLASDEGSRGTGFC